ncbi:NAD(P)-binding protein [Viridothelium virens]|uniref:NAD(P)-binding protein n=1 Tax=Viridothelium virens TaxID=1048519 RepID=A0A6A6HBP3_VIRVR|nr:NAD(P)-binding protein [Viridothelium virens]
MTARSILVTRATGTQGIAVCRHLRQKGFIVHGLARNISDERTAPLKGLDIEFFQGTEEDRDAVDRAVAGCAGVFLNTMPNMRESGSEARQSKTVLETAKAAGVEQVVNSTSIGVGRLDTIRSDLKTSLPTQVIQGKVEVEAAVRDAGIETWTILRSGYFMNNFLWPLGNVMFPELASERKFISSYAPDTPLALIDPDDIGAFTAAAFEDPSRFAGEVFELVGEKLPTEQAIEKLSAAVGMPIEAVYRTAEESEALAQSNPMVASQLMTLPIHKLADMTRAKSFGITMHTFDEFLTREKDSVRATFALEHGDAIKLF